MKTIATVLIALLAANALFSEIITARTDDGREVVLFDNGTWVFKPQPRSDSPRATSTTESIRTPASATERLLNRRGSYSISYDPKIWERELESESGDVEFFFLMKNEDAYAMTIFERVPIPRENLKRIVLGNMESVSTGARITQEKTLNVNGHEVMSLHLECTIEDMPFVYRGYYVSGDFGTIQFITFCHRMFAEEYQEEMDKMLAGLKIEQ